MRIHLDPSSGPASCAGCSHSSSASYKDQILVDASLEGAWVNELLQCSTSMCWQHSPCLFLEIPAVWNTTILLSPFPDLDRRLCANREYYCLWICAWLFKPWNPWKFPLLWGSVLRWQELAGLHHQYQDSSKVWWPSWRCLEEKRKEHRANLFETWPNSVT